MCASRKSDENLTAGDEAPWMSLLSGVNGAVGCWVSLLTCRRLADTTERIPGEYMNSSARNVHGGIIAAAIRRIIARQTVSQRSMPGDQCPEYLMVMLNGVGSILKNAAMAYSVSV